MDLRQINTCRKVPLQVNFFRWRYFSLPSMSLIFLRAETIPSTIVISCPHGPLHKANMVRNNCLPTLSHFLFSLWLAPQKIGPALQPLSWIHNRKHGSAWSTESGGQGRLLASIEADGGLELGEADQPSFGALTKVRNAPTTCAGCTYFSIQTAI